MKTKQKLHASEYWYIPKLSWKITIVPAFKRVTRMYSWHYQVFYRLFSHFRIFSFSQKTKKNQNVQIPNYSKSTDFAYHKNFNEMKQSFNIPSSISKTIFMALKIGEILTAPSVCGLARAADMRAWVVGSASTTLCCIRYVPLPCERSWPVVVIEPCPETCEIFISHNPS